MSTTRGTSRAAVQRVLPHLWIAVALLLPMPAAAQPFDRPGPALPPSVGVWLSGGAGIGTRGISGLLGTSVRVGDWYVGIRYLKSMSLGSDTEAYTEHAGGVIGRRFGSNGRGTVALGAARSQWWDQTYAECSGCAFGSRRTGGTERPAVPSVLLEVATRTAPLGGVLGAGLGLTTVLGPDASTIAFSVMIDAGFLR